MFMIEKSSFDAVLTRNRRLTDAQHLLSAVLHLLDKLPEESRELPVVDDIGALLQQAETAIKDAKAVALPPIPVEAACPTTSENSITA